MSDIALAPDGDILISPDGDIVLIEGADEVAQRVTITLRMSLGEWFRNPAFGIPYFEDILRKNPKSQTVDAIIRTAILLVEGVLELLEFNFDFNTQLRKLTVDTSIRSENGTSTISVTAP